MCDNWCQKWYWILVELVHYAMEMERSLQLMMERLFAKQSEEMKARQEKADADAKARQEKANADAKARHEEAEAHQEKMNAEMKASQERATAVMKVVQAEIKAAYAEIEARAEARHERFLARLDGLAPYGEGTTTCQTETTSCPREMKDAIKMEINPEETQAAVECQELQMEEDDAGNIGSSEDRSGYKRLAVRRRRGAKKRTQDSVGSRQKVSAASKRVIRRAIPAVRKGNICKCPGKDNVARGASRRKTLEERQRNNYECKNGRWDRDFKKRLCLRMKTTSERITRKPRELTSLLGLPFAICEVNENAFWKVLPPPKRKKELLTA
jgi:hypothetical protein